MAAFTVDSITRSWSLFAAFVLLAQVTSAWKGHNIRGAPLSLSAKGHEQLDRGARVSEGLTQAVKQELMCRVKSLLLMEAPVDPLTDLADSAMVEGADCGNVKQIIGKWAKAKKVGTIVGQAGAAIIHADHAANTSTMAAETARAAGKKLGTTASVGIEMAAEHADWMAGNATEASTLVDTALTTVKGDIAAADMAGAGVEDQKVRDLVDLTKKANDAAKAARDGAQRVLDAAEDAEAAVAAAAQKVLGKVAQILATAVPMIEQARDTAQKANWSSVDATNLALKADEAGTEIQGHIGNAHENETEVPVWKALKGNLGNQSASLVEEKDNLTQPIADLRTAADQCETALEPLKEMAQMGAGQNHTGVLAQEEMVLPAETAQLYLQKNLTNVELKVASMESKHDRLQEDLTAAEEPLGRMEAANAPAAASAI